MNECQLPTAPSASNNAAHLQLKSYKELKAQKMNRVYLLCDLLQSIFLCAKHTIHYFATFKFIYGVLC